MAYAKALGPNASTATPGQAQHCVPVVPAESRGKRVTSPRQAQVALNISKHTDPLYNWGQERTWRETESVPGPMVGESNAQTPLHASTGHISFPPAETCVTQ